MQPWKISVGLTAIIMAGALMLAGESFSWIGPYFWMVLTDFWFPVSWYAGPGPGHADVFDLLRCAAHGPCRHGPESGSDGAVHPARRRRASGACREDGTRGTRGVSGSLAPDRVFKTTKEIEI